MYLLFAVPLALFWLGVDLGVGDIDTQDLVVKVMLFVLSSQLFEEYIWIFSKVIKKARLLVLRIFSITWIEISLWL